MKIVHQSSELQKLLTAQRLKGVSIGFVPTMGYLHEGHLTLVRKARQENKLVVASIFVNPLQFGPKEDFWRYPRNLSRDTDLLKKERVDVLFVPPANAFYENDFQTQVQVKALSQTLCGVSRPTHFQGVATVVLKLLCLVGPSVIYLGQKDYQQVRVLAQMVKDLSFPVRVAMVPIAREADGVAMSSRNVLLSPLERRQAPFLRHALVRGAELVRAGVKDPARIRKAMREVLKLAPAGRVDYAEIVDATTLADMVKLKDKSKVLLALAVFFSKTRLIDNELVTVP